MILAKKKTRSQPRQYRFLSPGQYKQLGLIVVAALTIGLGLTRGVHDKVVALQARVNQLHASKAALVAENMRLETAGAQLTAKTEVTARAKRRLQLFAPVQGQVHRM